MLLTRLPEKVTSKVVVLTSLVLLVANFVVNNLGLSEYFLAIFNSVFELLFSVILTTCFLAYYIASHPDQLLAKRSFFWIGISVFCWFLGDLIWVYNAIQEIDAFPSPGDFFYTIAYLLLVISLIAIPGRKASRHRRNMVFIEITILVLSAIVILTVLMLLQGKPYLEFDPLTLLLVFIYPVLDMILIWVLMIVLFTFTVKNSRKILILLFVALIAITVSDLLYLNNTINYTLFPDYISDYGYYIFYIFLLLAGVEGNKLSASVHKSAASQSKYIAPGKWISFLPGIFLITIIMVLFVFVMSNSFVLFDGLIVLVSVIFVLFVIHQYLVISDNLKLTRQVVQVNEGLEQKVNERTAELSKKNKELNEEMKIRKEAETMLAQSNTELALVNQEKDRLFSILAHDLRSPLGSMMKLSELLAENIKDFDEDELVEIADTLNKSASNTFQLLDDLMAWSSVQMGRGINDKEVFLLAEGISDTILSFTHDAGIKDVVILTDIENNLKVCADKFAVQTIMRNLLGNALKFTPPNGTITVKARQKGEFTNISVTDTGTGIPVEKQERLFRLDSMSSSPGTEGEKGTGFGLLLCKDLVEKNGGNIGFRSEPGEGSTFFFNLPMHEKHIVVEPDQNLGAGRIELKYDHSKQLGFSTFYGEFNSEIMHTLLTQLWGRPDHNPDYSVLIDLRQAVYKNDVKDLQAMFTAFSLMPGNRPGKKYAILTTTPQQVAYSTMFCQHMKAKFNIKAEVFSTFEAAASWLGAS